MTKAQLEYLEVLKKYFEKSTKEEVLEDLLLDLPIKVLRVIENRVDCDERAEDWRQPK